jgi:hypothetical protein
MKFREKYKADHGIEISEAAKKNGIYPCPSKFGYEAKNPSICRRLLDCKSCWEREMEDDVAKAPKELLMAIKKADDEAKHDSVNHPSHYTKGGIECIDAIEAATDGLVGYEAVCTAQVIKYIWRWKWKNGIEDLKKARWYLDRLIAKVGKK